MKVSGDALAFGVAIIAALSLAGSVVLASITYRVEGLQIHISVEVHTIYRTGVEVEAMHGAAITALTMYDMLKPLDKGISISDIRLQEKKGGKSDWRTERPRALN